MEVSYSQHEISLFLFWLDSISSSLPCVSMATNFDVLLSIFNGTNYERNNFWNDGSSSLFNFISEVFASKLGMQPTTNLIVSDLKWSFCGYLTVVFSKVTISSSRILWLLEGCVLPLLYTSVFEYELKCNFSKHLLVLHL